MSFSFRIPPLFQTEAQPVASNWIVSSSLSTKCLVSLFIQATSTSCAASLFGSLASFGLGSHLVKAGEGGADLPDGRDGMDLMSEESWGRSVERERHVGRSIVGRWSAERDLLWYSCLSMAPWFLQRSLRDRQALSGAGPQHGRDITEGKDVRSMMAACNFPTDIPVILTRFKFKWGQLVVWMPLLNNVLFK